MPTVYNKVTANGTTLIDLSLDTVTSASDIVSGKVGHLADGTQVTGTGGGGNFTLIGTKVFNNVAEYTDTSTPENMDTEINIQNTDYAIGYAVVTCDSAITTSTEWGMSVCFWGRYTSNSGVYNSGTTGQKGSATLSKSAMVTNSTNWSAYGIWLLNNTPTIRLARKCHGTACPKIRAGNYTVKVYAMTGF